MRTSQPMSGSFWAWIGWGIVPLLLWSLVWKGLALWHAAKRSEKLWFIVFLVINTAGILEIIYLVFIAKLFASKTSLKRAPPRGHHKK